jgi:hypothetical protein
VGGPVGTFEGPGLGVFSPPKYLIQYRPVPGIESDKNLLPVGDTPNRTPGIPQLIPIPRFVREPRKPPEPNCLRNRHPMGSIQLCSPGGEEDRS